MIILAGQLKTSPDHVVTLADRLRGLADATLRQDGCLNYHFALDDPKKGTILVYERWRDQAALLAHLSDPPVVELLREWAEHIDTSGVREFAAADERDIMS